MSSTRATSPWLVFGAAAAVIVAATVLIRLHGSGTSLDAAKKSSANDCGQVATAYRSHETDVWLSLTARMLRPLPDEEGRLTHQRFLVTCTAPAGYRGRTV